MRGLPKTAGAEAWKKIQGLTEDTVEITVTERIYKRVVHSQAKYRLKDEYNTSDKEVIITAPGPVKVKPGMTYSVDFALAVVSDKYEYHIPLERQRRKMEAAGLEVDVKTLYSLCEAVAEHCHAVLPQIRHDIKNDYAAVCVDETPWRILSDKTLGQMWVMANRMGSYYQFEPTRSGAIAEEMLLGYDGAIITDAFGGYNRLSKKPTIRVQNCWAHARREFFERFDDFPDDCRRVIELIDQLFAIEREAKDVADIRRLRKEKSKPVVDELRNYLYEAKPRFLPGQGISKAINYCLNHWKGLTHFLTDSTVNISNNEAERALRHVVVGRKNFLGSQTINGADTATALYTVIETAKKCSLHPYEYLKYLITERWHKREPMTPKQYADKKFGPSPTIKWPARTEWQITEDAKK
jgi:transposase